MPCTPCRAHRCPNLVKSRSQKGYCDAHADKRKSWSRRREGTTTERGYGHSWRKLRAQILRRDEYLCLSCKDAGRIVEATDVDHILSKANGGKDNWDNLQSLCRQCHQTKTATE